jgi:hypothetical protein
MNELPLKSPGFYPPSPQGGVKNHRISKSPLGDLGVEIDERNWNNRFLKPPKGGLGVKNKGKKEENRIES